MRKIREVLRQKWKFGLSHRQIQRSARIGYGSVAGYLRRAKQAGLNWEKVESLTDEDLERLLFPPIKGAHKRNRPMPDWVKLNREMKKKGVTLMLLWMEYKERYPEGFGYSRFCELYRLWEGSLDTCLRQEDKGGEQLFVDYAGPTVEVINRAPGEVKEAQLFVAVLGASNYTYCEATWSQDLHDWVGSHVRTFEAFGGVTELVIPDNLKSAIKSACRYDAEVNRTYADLAEHYGVAVIPARVRKPKDKAKVESGVLVVERWILARIRNETFFSLGELNQRIAELLVDLNGRPLKVLGISRKALFEQVDQPALGPLPIHRYEFAEWKKARVSLDYHVAFELHHYSVPYQLLKKDLDLRATAEIVEIFHRSKRVAAHRRSRRRGGYTTLKKHMPMAHQEYLKWTPKRLVRWAAKSGPSTAQLTEEIMLGKAHPQQGFRACLGVMRLGEKYGADRLEAACRRALVIKSPSYKSVNSILKTNLDQDPLPIPAEENLPINHGNIRGASYYRGWQVEEVT